MQQLNKLALELIRVLGVCCQIIMSQDQIQQEHEVQQEQQASLNSQQTDSEEIRKIRKNLTLIHLC